MTTLTNICHAQSTLASIVQRTRTIAALCILTCGVLASLPTTTFAHDRYAPVYQGSRYAPVVNEYAYIYYPHQQVYFSPLRRQWFWLTAGNWQSAAYLPPSIRVDARWGVPITLRSERPYYDHVYVERTYGRPWRNSHAYDHWRHDRREEWREERRDDWRAHRHDEYRR